MVAKQYVSITDFFTVDQARQMRELIPRDSGLVLGVGVMMSWKTMNDIPTKWVNSFPPVYKIPSIFEPDPRVFNVLHYASDAEPSAFPSTCESYRVSSPYMEGLQLDIEWPSVGALRRYKRAILVSR